MVNLRGSFGVVAAALAISVFVATPLQAQVTLQRVLQTTRTSNLEFAPYTIGAVIQGSTDHVYKLRAFQGNELAITINSMGARAVVILFDNTGRQIKSFYSAPANSPDHEFYYTIPKTGDYYLFCYSGPTNHFYRLTIVIDIVYD
jgi:hypothetical protein